MVTVFMIGVIILLVVVLKVYLEELPGPAAD